MKECLCERGNSQQTGTEKEKLEMRYTRTFTVRAKESSSPNKNVLEDNTDLLGYSESSDATEEARNSH